MNPTHPMTTIERTGRHVMPTYARQPLAMARGEGSWIWDEAGKRYLDFCTGIAVCSLGHCHPAMRRALEHQAATLWHCSNLYHIPAQAELAEFLNTRVMERAGKVFFSNSGAEANDGLIKAARRFGHARPSVDGMPRTTVLRFRQSFHGRTLGGIAATGQDKVKEGFDPLLAGFEHLDWNDLDAVGRRMSRGDVAAVMLEPIQGEGGVHVVGRDFLLGLAELCHRYDTLLFFDEVQCGIGRTGGWRGWESVACDLAEAVRPDGVSWAKGMGGGYPIGAFWLGDRAVQGDLALHDLLGPGSHGSTYGGSPLACTVALSVLREIEGKNLSANALAMGRALEEGVLGFGSALVSGMRGRGLLLGIVLDVEAVNAAGHLPDGPTPAMRVVAACREQGLLVPPAGPDVVRLLPPLNVSGDEVHTALSILRAVLANPTPHA